MMFLIDVRVDIIFKKLQCHVFTSIYDDEIHLWKFLIVKFSVYFPIFKAIRESRRLIGRRMHLNYFKVCLNY